MKVVILCGGKGTRLREETEYRPKPMVKIGGRPIIWHIMKTYAHYGYKEFVLCLGYKGEMIKDYFLNYETANNDFRINLGSRNSIEIYNNHQEHDWTVTLANTGEDAQTGARIKKIERFIDGDAFMLTYGDGVCDINIKKLVEYHQAHGKIGTMTGVRPSSRFGELILRENQIMQFNEKPQKMDGMINGGYFIFNRKFFEYLDDDDNCYLEKEPLEKLARNGQLMLYPHNGFWQCMDTYRELEMLEGMWKANNSPWKVW